MGRTGVSLISTGPRVTGLGTEVITRQVPYELGGEGRIEFRPGGVRCDLFVPMTRGGSVLQSGPPPAWSSELPGPDTP